MLDLSSLESRDIEALAAASRAHNFRFVKVVQDFADSLKNQLVKADDMARVHRLQGRIEALEALVAAINEAASLK